MVRDFTAKSIGMSALRHQPSTSSALMVIANTVICFCFLLANNAQFVQLTMCQVSGGELWFFSVKHQHPIPSVGD